MIRLSSILSQDCVLIDVNATSKKRVFEEIGLLFERTKQLNRADVTNNLFAREKMGSTGIGAGVAIPHGCIKSIQTPLAAVLRLKEGIGFDADDGLPVTLLIVLLVPENAAQQHLETLSHIAQLLSDDTMREKLFSAVSAAAIFDALISWQAATTD